MGLLNMYHKCPYVYTLHIAPVPHDLIHKILTFKGYRTIAISNEVRSFLIEKLKVNPKRIDLVLNGVDETQLFPLTTTEKLLVRRRFGISPSKTVVSIHARISEIKNQLSVAKAVAMLSAEERQNLVILCSGEKGGKYFDEIMSVIKRNGIDKNFVFCGWASARDVIGCSDYMILPSISEGFPLNCVESMFLRVPVLRTKTGGYENIKPYCTGMENPSVECITSYLRKIISRNPDISDKVEIAERFVLENCTINQMTMKTLRVYQTALNK